MAYVGGDPPDLPPLYTQQNDLALLEVSGKESRV